MTSQDEPSVLERLKNLNPAQFDEVLFHLEINTADISNASVPQTVRAIEVIKMLRQKQEGLKRLESKLAELAIPITGKFEGRTHVETIGIQLKLSNQDKDVKLCYSLDSHPEERSLPLKEIEDIIRKVEQDYSITYLPALIEIGQRLYNWLNGRQDAAQGWLTEAIKRSQKDKKVVLLAIAATGKLAHLPWELLHDKESFLVEKSNPYLLPVRWLPEKDLSPKEPKKLPLRVLFMATSPLGIEPILDFEGEERKILKATADKKLSLSVEESGCLEELKKLVGFFGEDYFDIFHLTGHATIANNEPRFLTETNTGEHRYASAKEIAQAFDDRLPQLIFLSGCRTGAVGAGGAVEAMLSMAEQLLQKGARAVLGWGDKVLDSDAIDAAAILYGELSSGRELAVAVACTYQTLLKKKAQDWYLLRLYTCGERAVALPGALVLPPAQQESPGSTGTSRLNPEWKEWVATREEFVGRRRQIQNCLRFLNPKSQKLGVLIYGMGGLGKSSLARRLCDRLNDDYQTMVWAARINETSLTKRLATLLYNDKSLRETLRSSDDLEYRLMMVFEGLYKKGTKLLLVLDDFEKNLEPKDSKFELLPEAETVLKALVSAIHNLPHLKYRLIITCRYKFQFENLEYFGEQTLDALHGADVQKKLNCLISLNPQSPDTKALRSQVADLADGNPRLLELLTKKLPGKGAEQELYRLEHDASHLRQHVMAEELFKQVNEDLQQMLALALVFNLAIPKPVLVKLCKNRIDSTDNHINRAIAFGLLEVNSQDDLRVPRILPLNLPLNSEVVHAQAAQILYETWCQEGKTATEAQKLEIHRLALLGKAGEMAREIAISLSDRWLDQSRFDEAMQLCQSTIEVVKDSRIFLIFAQSEDKLGEVERAVKHCQQALEYCPLEDKEQKAAIFYHQATIKHTHGKLKEAWEDYKNSSKLLQLVQNDKLKAAILIGTAKICSDQGQLKSAIERYLKARKIQKRQLREIQERIDNAQGEVVVLYQQKAEVLYQQAAVLHQLAGICIQRNQVTRAISLCNMSIKIKERIGNTHGKATTLLLLAGICAQQGRHSEAINHYMHCLGIQQRIGDCQGRAATLYQLAGILIHLNLLTKATEYCQEALKIFNDINIKDKKGESKTLRQLAAIYTRKGEIVEAIKYCTESYKIERSIKHVLGQVEALVMLGMLFDEHNEQKDLTKALNYLQKAQTILEKHKYPASEKVSQKILGIQQKIRDFKPT